MSALQFITLSGIPIEIVELKWPFHPSTSGSDWFVLHGRVDLLNSAEKLHAEVAVAMTQTIKDALGSLAPENSEPMVVNAIRKTIDNGQLAFLKSGKLQPVHVTSRFYSYAANQVQFPTQADLDVRELIKHRVFWLGAEAPVAIVHPYDCQYLNLSREKMMELAGQVAAEGLISLSGVSAQATELLLRQAASIQEAMHKAVESGKAATKISA